MLSLLKDIYRKFKISRFRKSYYKNVRFGKEVAIVGKPKIGKYTYIGDHSVLGPNLLEVGNFCSIASNVSIGLNEHPIDKLSSSAFFYSSSWGQHEKRIETSYNKPNVKIAHDVWIGANAVILNNVTIGNGAIIGAGAIVTKDVNAYTIVVGNPAKPLRTRFNEQKIKEIEASQWWNKEVDSLFDFYNAFENE